ncbi:MAG TPA: DapH/DapD/GlmU-related protein [Candidatus Limnocylindria bacterium]|jgi:acetyltransferase-like isoleucine patch superfamily enzyme
MTDDPAFGTDRVVRAVHGVQEVAADPPDELAESAELRRTESPAQLLERYADACYVYSHAGGRQRRIVLRALTKSFGNGINVGVGVLVRHPHTLEIGDAVFIGNQTFLQGRHDGHCIIGAHTWIGPQSYFDCRDLELAEYVGWGPGAKVLGSEHTGDPVDVPIIQTDLVVRPVRVGAGADIGVNAVLLPGVHIGAGAIVGAGAVVTKNVPAYAVVAGVPAKVLRSRRAPIA